jgi:Holliday junction resolvase-like predicted endonuclease
MHGGFAVVKKNPRRVEGVESKHQGAHNELLATVWLLRQGYEVFRNVSAHGPIDLIAMKAGTIFFFDAKKVDYRADGSMGFARITKEQAALGVKIIRVFADGNCAIDDDPLVVGSNTCAPRHCEGCSKIFTPIRGGRYCADACRQVAWKKSRENNAAEPTCIEV